MLGLFLAEGHISDDGRRRRVCWSFHPTDEQHLVEFVAELLAIARRQGDGPPTDDDDAGVHLLAHPRRAGSSTCSGSAPTATPIGSPTSSGPHPTDAKQALLRGAVGRRRLVVAVERRPVGRARVRHRVGRRWPTACCACSASSASSPARRSAARASSTVDTHWLVMSGADQIEQCLVAARTARARRRAWHTSTRQTKRIAPTGYRLDRKGTAWVRVVDVVPQPGRPDGVLGRGRTATTRSSPPAASSRTTASRKIRERCSRSPTRPATSFDLLAGRHHGQRRAVRSGHRQDPRRRRRRPRRAPPSPCGASRSRPAPTTCATRRRISIIDRLLAAGATVRAFDPTVTGHQARRARRHHDLSPTPYDATDGADVLAVLTEWDDFRWLDPAEVAAAMTGRARRRRPQPARPHRLAARRLHPPRASAADGPPPRSPAAAASSARTSPTLLLDRGDTVTAVDNFVTGPAREHRPPRRAPAVHRHRARHHHAASRRRSPTVGTTRCSTSPARRRRSTSRRCRSRSSPSAPPAPATCSTSPSRSRRALLPRLDQRGLRRPAGAPAARDATGATSARIGPRSCYDEAKRFSEAITMAYHRVHGLDVRIVRIFNTYGERMRPDDGRVVNTFVVQALRGEPITLHGDGSQTRSFCHVADEVRGLIAVLDGHLTGPVNVGNPGEFTMRELAEHDRRAHRLDQRDRRRCRCPPNARAIRCSASPTSRSSATPTAGSRRSSCATGLDAHDQLVPRPRTRLTPRTIHWRHP